MFCWFDTSKKCKDVLKEFCDICNAEYHEVIHHVHVRCSSSDQSVYRILQQFNSLKSYFLSEEEFQARFQQLSQALKTL